MRALIIDDERLGRQELRRLLDAHGEIQVVGEARNVKEAVQFVESLEPDLLFLDIRMPGGSGFDLLESLERVPEVIFTTAYDQYAARVFQVNALDYLVKPIEPDRLAAAVKKVRDRFGMGPGGADRGESVEVGSVARRPLTETDRVFVRDGEHCWLVRLGDVLLMESEGNYTRLYFQEERPLIPRSLKHLDGRLDPRIFFRANRSQILNLNRVVSLEAVEQGRMVAVLENDMEVSISRRRAQEFRDRISL